MIDDQNLEMFPRDSASLEEVENRMRLLKEAYGFKAIFHTLPSSDEQDKMSIKPMLWKNDLKSLSN